MRSLTRCRRSTRSGSPSPPEDLLARHDRARRMSGSGYRVRLSTRTVPSSRLVT
jgi:hypothetical protein